MTSTPVNLGRSGLRVSTLCLGTMNFGQHTSQEDSHAILDESDRAGVHFVDTANNYGGRYGEGWTEQVVGTWLAKGEGRRERTVLATKLYSEVGPGPNESGLSALAIRRQCEASLRRLRTDYLDLYQMHHIDRSAPWDELWEAFDVLRQQGKILYVGTSNFPGWALAQGSERAQQRGSLGIVSEQSYYNLLQRTVELEVVPACAAYGIGLIPWSPLEQGLLGGVLRKEGSRRSVGERQVVKLERNRPAVQAYENFCDELGEDPANVALAWLLHQLS